MTPADQIMLNFKNIKFQQSEKFRWSPEDNIIFYNDQSANAEWSLLHEIGHVLCGHKSYSSDIGLLRMEAEAWAKARELSQDYAIEIEEEHIEKCLDSYRDWLYRRSSCPKCFQAGVETKAGFYFCINCKNQWKVTTEKFCRVYRKTVTAEEL